jgi:hypothetical protein
VCVWKREIAEQETIKRLHEAQKEGEGFRRQIEKLERETGGVGTEVEGKARAQAGDEERWQAKAHILKSILYIDFV